MTLFHRVSFCLRKGDCNLNRDDWYMARGKIASSPARCSGRGDSWTDVDRAGTVIT